MSVMNKALQKNQIERILKKLGVDADTVDVDQEIDEMLTLGENVDHIKGLIHKNNPEMNLDNVGSDVEKYEAMKEDIVREMVRTGELDAMFMRNKWKEIIGRACVVLICGKKGSGKSCTAYFLLEYLSNEYRVPGFVFGLPAEKKHLLPERFGLVEDINTLPDNAVILLDEGHLSFHARRSGTDVNILMDMLITISRQRGQILIFVTQQSRKIDVNVVAEAECIIVKEPAPFQVNFERPQLRDVIKQAKHNFDKIVDKEDRKKKAYVYSPEYIGMLENDPPSFWTDELSLAWGGCWNVDKSGQNKLDADPDEGRKFEIECGDTSCYLHSKPKFNPCNFCPNNKMSSNKKPGAEGMFQ